MKINTHTAIFTIAASLFCLSFAQFLVQCKSDNKTDISVINPGWRFSGHLGEYIDRISEHRILNEESWNTIYPETEKAFLIREDDRDYPERGVWRGEFWGKYMLSVIAAYHYYDSELLRKRIDQAVRGLLQYQEGNGYLGTYKHSDFVIGNNWNVWCRKYTLWGLVEASEILQDDQILDAASRFTDHLISEVGPEATDIVRTGNFYGMPSSSILQPVVKLYNATKNEKYLDFALYIVDQWKRHPTGVPDILNKGLEGKPVHTWFDSVAPYEWAKGYEFTSCVEGLAELYNTTGNDHYLEAARNIHEVLTEWERTPVGSVSFNDKYVGSAGLINTVSEICDVVYWNRLSFQLYQITGEEKYVDEIERALYNALLCAYNPEGTWGIRRLRTSHIHIPAQNHFLDHHQCCTDNLPRALYQAADVAVGFQENTLTVNIFNEGEGLFILESGELLSVEITGDYLSGSASHICLDLKKPEHFRIKIRNPGWSDQTTVSVNGKMQQADAKVGYFLIEKEWKKGDRIGVEFDMHVRCEQFEKGKVKTCFHDLDFYETEWAKLKFTGATNPDVMKKYNHVKSLDPDEKLPHRDAVVFFYGPLALSRDIRVTKQNIFSVVKLPEDPENLTITETEPPPAIWKTFDLTLGDETIGFCDFSSAGNTWNMDSEFNTWCITY